MNRYEKMQWAVGAMRSAMQGFDVVITTFTTDHYPPEPNDESYCFAWMQDFEDSNMVGPVFWWWAFLREDGIHEWKLLE